MESFKAISVRIQRRIGLPPASLRTADSQLRNTGRHFWIDRLPFPGARGGWSISTVESAKDESANLPCVNTEGGRFDSVRSAVGKLVMSGLLDKRSRQFRAVTKVFLLSSALIGCAEGSNVFYNPSQRVQGPVPVVKSKTIEAVDLIAELSDKKKLPDEWQTLETNRQLALAYDEFYKKAQKSTVTEGQKKLLRNRIQGRLLQASDQACGVYINFLRQLETEFEFTLGTMAVLLAGAGAIVTNLTAAQALSGSAAIAEGTRAEFRQAFFSNLATHVIVPGIENRRIVILEGDPGSETDDGIMGNRDLTLEEYPVEHAVKDALFYHAHCNLMAGLVEASELIELAKRPGINAMNQALKEMGETRTLIQVITGQESQGVANTKEKVNELLVDVQAARETADEKIADFANQVELLTKSDDLATALSTVIEERNKAKDKAFAKLKGAFDTALGQAALIADETAKHDETLRNPASSRDSIAKARNGLLDQRAALRLAKRDVRLAIEALTEELEKELVILKDAVINERRRRARAKIEALDPEVEAQRDIILKLATALLDPPPTEPVEEHEKLLEYRAKLLEYIDGPITEENLKKIEDALR